MDSLNKLEAGEIKLTIHGIGDVVESDVRLASASKAIIIGFKSHDPAARRMADSDADIRHGSFIN
jgi:translation initiation factor IF-2